MIANADVSEPISLGATLIADKKVAPDATLLLTQDHREALSYFSWYEMASDTATRVVVAKKLCAALRAHMAVEEEIFYPLAREATRGKGLIAHAIEEHKQARAVIDRAEAALKRRRAPDADCTRTAPE